MNKVIEECVNANPNDFPLLNMLTWNVRCLTHSKLDVIKHYLDEWTRLSIANNKNQINCNGDHKNYFTDIICLTETWLPENNKFNTFNIKNFNAIQANRKLGKKGGGLLIFVHKKYQTIVVKSEVNDDIEYILIKLITANDELHVLLIYRPNGCFETFINTIEELALLTNRDKLIITGDMNINLLNQHDKNVKTYLDTLMSLNLKIFNTAVTRNSFFGADGSLIDHSIMSSSHDKILALTSKRTQLVSDHNYILSILQLGSISPKKRKRIKKNKINYELLPPILANNLFDEKLNYDDVNQLFNATHDILLKSIKECTTVENVKMPSTINSLPEWADDRYLEMLKTLHNLEEKIDKKKALNLPRSELVAKYNDLSDIFEKYGNAKKKVYYRKLQLQNTNHAWKIINDLTGRTKKSKVAILRDEHNNYITDSLKIANAFQKKFIATSSNQRPLIESHKYIGKLINKTFNFDEVSSDTIANHIALLNESKSCGYDGISAKVIKCCVNELSPILTSVFNLMIRTGKYPDRLKQSTVIPIHKGGDSLDCGNYRPISLLLQLDKIFEAILYSQLNKYLENQKIFDPLQYGFRQGRGCNEAIGMLLNNVSKTLDSGKNAIIISLDIHKAFDSVDHRILLRKLNFLGIRGPAYDILLSFLTNRKQIVQFNEAFSSTGDVEIGVPQGSNLGPLLFNLLINDISSLGTKAKLLKYADDVVMILPLDKNSPHLNIKNLKDDMRLIMSYYETNLLKVNLTKSKYMILGGNDHDELNELLEDYQVIKCNEITYLGCIIDSQLKFDAYVDKISKAIGSAVNALRHLKSVLSQDALIKFFHAHIQSHVIYTGSVLLRCRSIDIERLQRLQSKALKIIFGLPDLYSTFDLFKKEAKNILPINGLIYNAAIVLTRKCVVSKDGSLPSIKRLRSRRKSDLILEPAKKKVYKDDLCHTGCKLYNQLPDDIKAENIFFLFKKDVKRFLLSRNESLVKSGQFNSKNLLI